MVAVGFVYGGYILAQDMDDTEVEMEFPPGSNYTATFHCGSWWKPEKVDDCNNSGGDILIAMFCLQVGAPLAV